ncbi:MAG: nitroreductase [Xanthomonadaceae bacterium]|nr:nitroreductase [Xanthomonadaceae bacterium]
MLTLQSLSSRLSTPTRQLAAPGPGDAQLRAMLQTAAHVPDHGKRVPFRFLRIVGDARQRLAAAAEARLRVLEPAAGDAVVEKLRTRFTLPPVTIAIVARLGDDEKIPASERFSSACCVAFQLLLAAHAEGFGAQWLTGWPAHDRVFLEHTLGLAADEQLVGTIAIGTATVAVPERERPDAAALLTDWPPRP